MSTQDLYNELRKSASRGVWTKTHSIIEILTRDRHELPNLQLFAAKILVNVDDHMGSAVEVAEILRELRSENLQPDAGLCHDILRVLAIHPDFLLQTEVLDYMRQKWFTLSAVGEHDVIVGLLADHQYELALDRLERLWNEEVVVEDWLLNMVAYVLLENEEVETAFHFMKASTDKNVDSISPAAWYQLLSVASGNYHYDATVYTWRLRVISGCLNPPSGICINVLNTAARNGDTQLATDVLRVLGDRGTKFGHEHYEALVDTYARYGDIDTALKVLCLMDSENVRPEPGSTRSIFQALKSKKEETDKAIECLRGLQSSGGKVPTTAMNVALEAMVQQERYEEAFRHYQAVHEICAQGPNTDTFNILLRACRNEKSQAMFLASEMRAFKITANELTYDRIILACLRSEKQDHEDAMRYYIEMRSQGWKLRRGTHFMLLQRCVEAVDTRAPAILQDMLHLPDNSYLMSRRWFERNWAGPPIDDLLEAPKSIKQSFQSPRQSGEVSVRGAQPRGLENEQVPGAAFNAGDEVFAQKRVQSSG
ncbi:MAG: hypothetical protein M1821_008129 [Bathelium mastoideum]|nr:MAG: hypothetical protein M1821_008129 [Bathelium mastoideum]